MINEYVEQTQPRKVNPDANSTVSERNSTNIPLTAGAVFTGEWEDVTRYPSIVTAIKTDQNGTLQIQFSPDGTNIDSTLTQYYHTDHIEAPHRYTVTRKYARVLFTNTSVTGQTYLRLQTLFGQQHDLNAPTDSLLAQHFDATVVRPTDYKYEVALGLRQGRVLWNKFAYNADVDTGTEVVASFGGTFTPLTTARTLSIVSTSAEDAAGGTGAQNLVVYYIDENYESQTAVVVPTGTTPVVTTFSVLGINRVAVGLSGSSQGNVGTITATATTDLTVQAQLVAGEGTTQQLIFFTSANSQALAEWLVMNAARFASGTQPIVTFKGWVYSAVSNTKYEVFRQLIDTSVDSYIPYNPSLPFLLGEKSCFWVEATTTQNNTSVSGRFSLIECRDFDAGLSA